MILKDNRKIAIKISVILLFVAIIGLSLTTLLTSTFASSNIQSINSEKENLVVVVDKSKSLENPKVSVISKDKLSDIKDKSKLSIEKNGKSYLETTPNDTFYSNSSNLYALPGVLLDSWNLRDINLKPTDEVANSGWKITTGSSNTIVATIDTGIDTTHSDLASNLWVNSGEIPGNGIDDDHNGYVDDVNGYNFASSNGNVSDTVGHGTHVAGIIAGVGNNGLGVAGVCWTCKIMALKVINSQGFAYDSDVALAITYAANNGAKVINISLGGGSYSSLIDAAARDAFINHGALVVSASGNSSANASDSYPGAATYSLNVGSSYTNINDPLSNFSNYGNRMDILAPGGESGAESVLSTFKGNQYALMTGTSMASPHVAGVAALLYDLHRGDITPWTAKEVRYALLSKALDITNVQNGYSVGFDTKSGYGKLDAYASLGTLNSDVSFLSSDVLNPTASLNTLGNTLVKGNVNITGSVFDANPYDYTVYFERASDNAIIMQRSGRGNVTLASLLNFDTSLIPDDSYKVYARAEDESGNVGVSNVINMDVDNTPPSTFNLSSPGSNTFVNTQNPILSWTSSTDNHGPVSYDIYINGHIEAFNVSTNTFQTSSNFQDSSTNTWYVIAKDTLGNSTQSVTNQFTIDLTPPIIANTNILVNNTGAHVSFSATENSSGISSYQISLNGGSFTAFTPPYTNNSLPDGIYNFVIRVYNSAGSYSEFSGTFIVNARKIYLTSKADFNNDGKVDLSDLSILAKFWGQGVTNADSNFDGKVNLSDLSILATNWNKSY